MATRLYLTDSTPAVTPTWSAGWEATTGAIIRAASATIADAGPGVTTSIVPNGTLNTDYGRMMFVYGPLSAQTVSGTVKGQFWARENGALNNADAQLVVKLWTGAGALRAVCLDFDTSALAHEFRDGATFRNTYFPKNGGGVSLTSQAASAGDYLVAEVGFRSHGTNSVNSVWIRSLLSGGSGADGALAENETTLSSDANSDKVAWLEFSANIALPTGTVSSGVATAIGVATNPTVTWESSVRNVNINGIDYTANVRQDAFALTECANRGEVGTGGFDVTDRTSALDIPALKAVRFVEPAATGNTRVYSGIIHDRSVSYITDGASRSWAVETTDSNILAQNFVITDTEGGNRGAETDYARVLWLITSTALGTVAGVGNGNVVNTNTVTMEATDYRGRKAADVLAECSEAAGKLWFIYDWGAGRLMYYDTATGTALSSSTKISDVDADTDGSTVFAPVGNVTVTRSPDRIYSKIHLTYNGGTVTVSNATTATNYRQREAAVLDSSITDATLATVKANALLAGAAAELLEIGDISIVVPKANVNDIRAGQRMQIKLTRQGIGSYTYYRVIRRTVSPLGIDHYQLTFGLASDVLASANGSRGSDEVWPNKSNANDDGATVRIDRGGITITGGGITVTNDSGTVIIDGTSDMFKIAASGSQNSGVVATGSGGGATTTLSGLGTLSATPIGFLTHAWNSSAVGTAKFVGRTIRAGQSFYAAASSGGGVTHVFLANQDSAGGHMSLNGSNQAVVTLAVQNESGGNDTVYQQYYVLQETAF